MIVGGEKMLNRFELMRPQNLEEALSMKASYPCTPIAGGTDLLVKIKQKMLAPQQVMDLTGLKELSQIKETGDRLCIGALATHTEIMENPLVQKYAPLLVEGCNTIGSPQIRNRGTIGGNIITASPAADTVPPLVCLNARVILSSTGGQREMSLEDFITGPGETQLAQDELLVKIVIDKMKPEEKYVYRKLGQRKALAISIASLALRLEIDESKRCTKAAVAFGAVSPVIKRATNLENYLSGQVLTDEVIQEVVEMAKQSCDPITDIRASKEYRKNMCGSLLWESLLHIA